MAAIATGLGDIGADVSSGGMESALGAALSEGYDAAAGGEEVPVGEAGNEPTLPVEGEQEAPLGEEPALQATDQPVEAQPTQDGKWALSEDGKFYQMPKGEYPAVQSAMQYAEAVGQYFATPQDAQFAARDASDIRMMQNDWRYGTDTTIQAVMNHWMGANQQDPATRMAFQRSFTKMLSMAPQALKGLDPQAHSSFVSNMAKSVVDAAYEKAAQTGNKDDLTAAQSIEWGLTGQYKTELPKTDPAAQAQAQFEQQRREFEQRQNTALQRDVAAWNQSALEGAKFTQLGAQIDKVLGADKPGSQGRPNLKERLGDVAYADLKAGIQRELLDTLQKQEWYGEHKQNFDQLVADYRMTWNQAQPGQGLKPRVDAYISDFLARAGRVLPSIAQKRVNGHTQARLASAQAGRPRTQGNNAPTSQARPNAPGRPAQQPNRRATTDEFNAAVAAVFR